MLGVLALVATAVAVALVLVLSHRTSPGPVESPPTTASPSPGTAAFVGTPSCPTEGGQPYAPNPPATNGPPVGRPVPEMPHTHVAEGTHIEYRHDPPTSGCHYSISGKAPVPPGVHADVIAPEYWVHNLEHGYVVVLYSCDLGGCPNEVAALRRWFTALPPDPAGTVPYAKVLVLPRPAMPVRFAVVSWDWYDPMPTLDIGEVQRFYANHVDQAPEGNDTG